MNKILVYTVIAIMLGTVTMLAPLALLDSSDPNFATVPAATESVDQNRTFEDSQTLGGENLSAENWTDHVKPSESEQFDSSSQYTVTVKTGEDASDLSPVGLMVVPSFLVALGVFVLLRKRMG
jgi:hypothetical protein